MPSRWIWAKERRGGRVNRSEWSIAPVAAGISAASRSGLSGGAGGGGAAGVGAAVGATVMIRDRRGQEAIIDDKQIEFKGQDWPGSGSKCQVAVNSYNRVVLLTGQCKDEAGAKAYAERVSKVPKVSRVIDEITIGPFASLNRQSEDTLITSRAKLALVDVDIQGFDPTRVTVITESGIVYLMGLVTTEEAEAAVDKVRYVPGVTKVVKVFEITNKPTTADAKATSATAPRLTFARRQMARRLAAWNPWRANSWPAALRSRARVSTASRRVGASCGAGRRGSWTSSMCRCARRCSAGRAPSPAA